ncbi:helix-turn-helix domain-containing protein [Modestobacter excelsi]|uniref:helix-turn-helix domain-containing protein n=1 Tax=Modestobacter excelsi TaxID=2213161 RepID=UPI00110CFD56|nr:helix-turn-helix transcriptional regulator [Modestobacter excelsi]
MTSPAAPPTTMTPTTADPVPLAANAAGFTVLHVANDEDVLLRPAGANDPDSGRVAVRVRPGMRRTDWLTRDLLAALGVDFGVTGSGRNADENLQLLPVRLVARRITDVLVGSAESLTPTMLTDLVLLAAAARTRLWLVTAPPVAEAVTIALGDWCAVEMTVGDATAAWPGLLVDPDGTPADATAPADNLPARLADPGEPRHLPLVDATTLLAASRRLLTTAEAGWVHRRLAAAVSGASHELSTDPDPAADPTNAIAAWLLDRYDSAGTLTQFLCDVRGLQVAGLWRGLLIQVDVPALLGTAAAAPSAAARTPAVWRRLRAYRLPVRAAACALASARLGSSAICALTVADVAPDGATVTTDGITVVIEPDAAAYVAEQRLLRLASGAVPGAPLLTTSTGSELSHKGLARLLSEARTELGVVVTSRLVERRAPDTATTLRRWGVAVTSIGPKVPGTPDTTTPAASQPTADTGTPSAAVPLLDVALLRRRKMELRLSRNDIAKHLGVTTAVVGRLESGVNHAEQPLGLLLRLAGMLGVDLADLLPHRRASATRPNVVASENAGADDRGEGPEDVRLLGAALHTLAVLVPVESLADVLGWDAARLATAINGLELAAPAVGLRVHRLQNRVSLVRATDALPAEALAAVLRYDAARTGLDTTQARLVHAALTRAVTDPTGRGGRGGRHMLARSNAEKVAAGSLGGAGMLTTDDAGDLCLTDDAAVSLLVPPQPRPGRDVPTDAHAALDPAQEAQ